MHLIAIAVSTARLREMKLNGDLVIVGDRAVLKVENGVNLYAQVIDVEDTPFQTDYSMDNMEDNEPIDDDDDDDDDDEDEDDDDDEG